MVHTCCVCKWRADKKSRRSFHKFPSDENERKKWLHILEKNNTVLGTEASVCSLHFEKNCFRYGAVMGRTLLKKGSLPSLYLTTTADPSLQKQRNEFLTVKSDFCELSCKSSATNGECSTEKITTKRPGEVIENIIPKKKFI